MFGADCKLEKNKSRTISKAFKNRAVKIHLRAIKLTIVDQSLIGPLFVFSFSVSWRQNNFFLHMQAKRTMLSLKQSGNITLKSILQAISQNTWAKMDQVTHYLHHNITASYILNISLTIERSQRNFQPQSEVENTLYVLHKSCRHTDLTNS